MQSKPERSEGSDVTIRPAPEGAGRTTPEQTGHYTHYNTKLTNSRYFHGNSHRIGSHWTAVAAILFLQIQWALSPPLYLNKSNRTDCTTYKMRGINWPAWLDACASECSFRLLIYVWSQCIWAAVNDLNSVWSSTSLCGTPVGTPNPLREAMTSQWSNLRALLSLTILSTNSFVPSMT